MDQQKTLTYNDIISHLCAAANGNREEGNKIDADDAATVIRCLAKLKLEFPVEYAQAETDALRRADKELGSIPDHEEHAEHDVSVYWRS